MSKKAPYTHDMRTALSIPQGAFVFGEIVVGLIEYKNGKKTVILRSNGSEAITALQKKKFNIVNAAIADALLKATNPKKNAKKHKQYLEATTYDT